MDIDAYRLTHLYTHFNGLSVTLCLWNLISHRHESYTMRSYYKRRQFSKCQSAFWVFAAKLWKNLLLLVSQLIHGSEKEEPTFIIGPNHTTFVTRTFNKLIYHFRLRQSESDSDFYSISHNAFNINILIKLCFFLCVYLVFIQTKKNTNFSQVSNSCVIYKKKKSSEGAFMSSSRCNKVSSENLTYS